MSRVRYLGPKLFGATAVAGYAGWYAGLSNDHSKTINIKAKVQQTPHEVATYLTKLTSEGFEPFETKHTSLFKLHEDNMFSRGILCGKDRVIPDVQLKNTHTGELVFLFRVGATTDTKKHFPTVSTTLFDEFLAQAAFQNLPNKVGVTGTLEIGPITGLPVGNGYIALYAKPTAHKGRRSEAEGTIYTIDGKKNIASARVIMIEPFWAKYLAIFL